MLLGYCSLELLFCLNLQGLVYFIAFGSTLIWYQHQVLPRERLQDLFLNDLRDNGSVCDPDLSRVVSFGTIDSNFMIFSLSSKYAVSEDVD